MTKKSLYNQWLANLNSEKHFFFENGIDIFIGWFYVCCEETDRRPNRRQRVMNIDTIFSALTESVVIDIDQGIIPWSTYPIAPINIATRKPYGALNRLLQYQSAKHLNLQNQIWGSVGKWEALGAKIKTGSSPTPIISWNDGETKLSIGYNIDQITGYSENLLKPNQFSIDAVNNFFNKFPITVDCGSSTKILEAFHNRVKWAEQYVKNNYNNVMNAAICDMGCALLAVQYGLNPALYSDPENFAMDWIDILTNDRLALNKIASFASRRVAFLNQMTKQKPNTATSKKFSNFLEQTSTVSSESENPTPSAPPTPQENDDMRINSSTKQWIVTTRKLCTEGYTKADITRLLGIGYGTIIKIEGMDLPEPVLPTNTNGMQSRAVNWFPAVNEMASNGKSMAEISVITKLSPPTVKKLLQLKLLETPSESPDPQPNYASRATHSQPDIEKTIKPTDQFIAELATLTKYDNDGWWSKKQQIWLTRYPNGVPVDVIIEVKDDAFDRAREEAKNEKMFDRSIKAIQNTLNDTIIVTIKETVTNLMQLEDHRANKSRAAQPTNDKKEEEAAD